MQVFIVQDPLIYFFLKRVSFHESNIYYTNTYI